MSDLLSTLKAVTPLLTMRRSAYQPLLQVLEIQPPDVSKDVILIKGEVQVLTSRGKLVDVPLDLTLSNFRLYPVLAKETLEAGLSQMVKETLVTTGHFIDSQQTVRRAKTAEFDVLPPSPDSPALPVAEPLITAPPSDFDEGAVQLTLRTPPPPAGVIADIPALPAK